MYRFAIHSRGHFYISDKCNINSNTKNSRYANINEQMKGMKGMKYFKCIIRNKSNKYVCKGIYYGKTLRQAKQQACRSLFTMYKYAKKIKFFMHECTHNNKYYK